MCYLGFVDNMYNHCFNLHKIKDVQFGEQHQVRAITKLAYNMITNSVKHGHLFTDNIETLPVNGSLRLQIVGYLDLCHSIVFNQHYKS